MERSSRIPRRCWNLENQEMSVSVDLLDQKDDKENKVQQDKWEKMDHSEPLGIPEPEDEKDTLDHQEQLDTQDTMELKDHQDHQDYQDQLSTGVLLSQPDQMDFLKRKDPSPNTTTVPTTTTPTNTTMLDQKRRIQTHSTYLIYWLD